MSYINAISFAPNVIEWLANSRHPRILHIFDHACNLINERREIISVVTPQIGKGPFNLVIEEDTFISRDLSLESPITIFPNQLILADLTINTTHAKLWSPQPDWKRLHCRKDEIFDQIMSLRAPTWAKQSLPGKEIVSSYTRPGGRCQGSTRLAMTPITDSLNSALVTADFSSSLVATRKLAGLGIGLTPAGDDYLIGAIYATWIIHPIEKATNLAGEIAETAAPLTTSLSAAWLRSAGRGEAGILWHGFFEALISEDSAAIRLQISKLLSVGHTSGADMLAGFIGTFLSLAESEKKLCHS